MSKVLHVLLNCIYLLLCILFSSAVKRVESNLLNFNEALIEENFDNFFNHINENSESLFGNSFKFLSDFSESTLEISIFNPKDLNDLTLLLLKKEIKDLTYGIKILMENANFEMVTENVKDFFDITQSKFDPNNKMFIHNKNINSSVDNKSVENDKENEEIIDKTKNKLFDSKLMNNRISNHTDGILCKTCLWTFTKFHQFLHKKYGLTLLNEILALLCATTVDYSVCRKAIYLYSPQIYDAILEHYLDAEFICTKSKMCKVSHYIELNPDDYARYLLHDKPENIEIKPNEQARKLKFLHVTDIHTDLLYKEGSRGLCGSPICCREETGKAKSKLDYSGKWGYQGKCDIPLNTLEHFVKTIVTDIKPDFIIWTGDNPPHTPWKSNYEDVYNSTKVFVDLLYNKYNYTNPVFLSIGNHEEAITDQFYPFAVENNKEFLAEMKDIFHMWIGEEESKTFLQYGYFTTKLKDTNLRIISLNCFLCDILNFYLIKDPTDPFMQFEWLESVLRSAEKKGENVFIISHIPPGDTNYMSECSKRYIAIIDRFQNIIRGQFFGHTHYDEFKLIPEYFNANKTAGVVLTAPSLTTYSFQNPSFRVYEMDSDSKILLDYFQYRLNLTEANEQEQEPEWKVAYRAKEFFNLTHLSDFNGWRAATDRLVNDKEWFEMLISHFFGDGVAKDSYIQNANLSKYFSCRYRIFVFDDYLRCTHYKTWDYTDFINKLVESLSGKWYEKIIHNNFGKHFLGNKN